MDNMVPRGHALPPPWSPSRSVAAVTRPVSCCWRLWGVLVPFPSSWSLELYPVGYTVKPHGTST